MKFIKLFKELGKDDAALAGGKGASLGEMTNAGIPVPPGFVLTTKAFQHFLSETELFANIDSILHKVNHHEVSSVEKASEEIQGLIHDATMPASIRDEVRAALKKLHATYVAVRSSATAEDSSAAAWAGQLDSYLNTTEKTLLENVKRCWASLFTPRAIFYRFEKALHGKEIAVAVVVQKMVQSEVSGVAFSVHPVTQDRNQLIIEATYGLGEAIVSGQVTPDSYIVEKKALKLIEKNVAEKKRGIYRIASGNDWKKVAATLVNAQALSDKQVLALSQLVIRIEDHYKFPCDIEWALEANTFYIVQSRPITTLKPPQGSADSDLPLDHLSSIKYHYIHKRFRTPLFTYLLWDGVSHHYNDEISFTYEMPELLYLDQELMFGKEVWDNTEDLCLAELKKNPRFIIETFKKAYLLNDRIVALAHAIASRKLSDASNKELAASFEEITRLLKKASAFMIFPLFVEEYLQMQISTILSPEVFQIFSKPVKPSATQEQELDLLRLAIKEDAGKNIDKDIHNHIAEFGWLKNTAMNGQFYSHEEIERKVKTFKQPTQHLAELQVELKHYNALVKKEKARIPDKKIRDYVDTLQEAIWFRSWRTERFYRNAQFIRGFFEEITKRIGADIFFLLPSETIRLLAGQRVDRSLVAQRKTGYIMYANGKSTRIYSGPIVQLASEKIQFKEQSAANDISGQCAYPGKARAIVCLIRTKQDFKKMRKGLILVAHSTQPDYVPIMKLAASIVTDEGGLTCHTSITARELKIPTVIGTKNATQLLKDGDLVEINADKGTVRIVKK